jgi:3-oxoacyl-[acyl-carrier-protein] synthase III
MQHRSEAAEALTMAGASPGDIDLMVYLTSRG